MDFNITECFRYLYTFLLVCDIYILYNGYRLQGNEPMSKWKDYRLPCNIFNTVAVMLYIIIYVEFFSKKYPVWGINI